MNAMRIFFLGLSAFAGLSAPAVTNQLETAVLSFPDARADRYRPDLAARYANLLIRAGNEAAYAALGEATRVPQPPSSIHDGISERERMNSSLCHLCRLLFVHTNSTEPLRLPRLGALALLPYESFEPADWPDLPFAITKGVPLCICLGYNLAGRSERAADYLANLKAYGTLRQQTFSIPTQAAASNALNEVFSSSAWKGLKWSGEHYQLDETYAKEHLWEQIKNMANSSGAANGSRPFRSETNRASAPDGSGR
jgi:hypothetical protein